MAVLRVGFVGAGFVAHFHARAMEQVREMELVGVLDRGGAGSLCRFACERGLGVARMFKTVSEMAEHVDAIGLFCPNDRRVEVMEEITLARRKGARLKGILVEKPLGRNYSEAKRVVELAETSGLLTAYFENQIHMKAIQVALYQLRPQQKNMGPLSLTRSSEEHSGPHNGWFWDPRRQGGGVLSDMGCHSIAVGRYALTPDGENPLFLSPESVSCDLGLLKWGQRRYREKLFQQFGVDYSKSPAEDFATGIITYRNPKSGALVKSQFTDSWMFEKQGLRLFMDGMGPGYAFEVNTLISSLNLFIGDETINSVENSESALEKSTASRGLLAVQYDEPGLYGYVDENRDAAICFLQGKNALLDLHFGLATTKLVMGSYYSAEKRLTVDLTKPEIQKELETYIPLIQRGGGADLLY